MPPVKPKRTGGNRNQPIVSCLECRRMKWKCDRQFPCAHCRRRGLGHMCPDGLLRPVRDAPQMLDESRAMQGRIAELEGRMAAAEALLAEHGLSLPDGHDAPPELHSPPQLRIHQLAAQSTATIPPQEHAASEVAGDSTAEPATGDPAETMVADGGQLTLGDEPGSSFWFGGAGSHYLWHSSVTRIAQQPDRSTSLLFGKRGRGVKDLLSRLPERAQSDRWADIYFEIASFMNDIVKRYWFTETLDQAYAESGEDFDSQTLSIVYGVLAIGATMDADLPPYNDAGEQLFNLARSALDLNAAGSKELIQALHLMSRYVVNSSRAPETYSGFWTTLGTAARCALQLGLHKDGAKFGMEPMEVETRRRVFWEINTEDILQSLTTGRPKSSMYDTEYPSHDERQGDSSHNLFHRYKYRIARILGRSCDLNNTVTPISYADIMALHQALVEIEDEIPPALGNTQGEALISPWQQLYLRLLVTEGYMFVHRWAFKRCLLDFRDEPFRAPFQFSYVKELVASETVLAILRDALALDSELACRFWIFYFHAFTAFINFASLVIRSPLSSLALNALVLVDDAVALFEMAANHARGRELLPTIKRVAERARNSFVLLDRGDDLQETILEVGHKLVCRPRPNINVSRERLVQTAAAATAADQQLPYTLEAATVAVAEFVGTSNLPQLESWMSGSINDPDLSPNFGSLLSDDFTATLASIGVVASQT